MGFWSVLVVEPINYTTGVRSYIAGRFYVPTTYLYDYVAHNEAGRCRPRSVSPDDSSRSHAKDYSKRKNNIPFRP